VPGRLDKASRRAKRSQQALFGCKKLTTSLQPERIPGPSLLRRARVFMGKLAQPRGWGGEVGQNLAVWRLAIQPHQR
jgi:hypothetical protein